MRNADHEGGNESKIVSFKVKGGLRREFAISPQLFNIFVEKKKKKKKKKRERERERKGEVFEGKE